jgi:hypothetical protein
MDTNKPDPSTDGSQPKPGPERQSSGVSRVRRKLIKGGALVPPVMLTLRSGAAVAQTSAGTCLGTNQSAAAEAQTLSSTKDGWMRQDVIVKEARRVRKKRGKWHFKGQKIARVYTHSNGNRGTWISLRPGLAGKRWRLVDTGRDIVVYDITTGQPVLTGSLMHRRGNPLRKYIAIEETPAYGLLQFDANGDLIVDSEGDPVITEVASSTEGANALTASCWASLHPTAAPQV